MLVVVNKEIYPQLVEYLREQSVEVREEHSHGFAGDPHMVHLSLEVTQAVAEHVILGFATRSLAGRLPKRGLMRIVLEGKMTDFVDFLASHGFGKDS